MPIRITKKEMARLNPDRVETRPKRKTTASKKRAAPSKDGAHTLAAYLRHHGKMTVLTAKEHQEREGNGTYRPDMAVREYRFIPGRNHQADFAWPAHRLIVEVDGGTKMVRKSADGKLMVGGRHNTAGDRWKTNQAAILRWYRMVFTTEDLKNDPIGCVKQIQEALKALQKG